MYSNMTEWEWNVCCLIVAFAMRRLINRVEVELEKATRLRHCQIPGVGRRRNGDALRLFERLIRLRLPPERVMLDRLRSHLQIVIQP